MEKESKGILYQINFDIINLLKIINSIGWDNLRLDSIHRILYFSGLFFTFRYPDKTNPFSEYYYFDIGTSGPYYSEINSSLIFLESNEYIAKKENIYFLKKKTLEIPNIEIIKLREEWIMNVIYILGLYGEGKIYDFIIRDPQLRDYEDRNVTKGLVFDTNNKTIEFLNSFKKAFEDSLKKDAEKIDNKEYLELYFEFVFSKIAKGDIYL